MGFFYISAPYLQKSREATIRQIRQIVLRKNLADGKQITMERSKFKLANLDTLMFVNDKILKMQNAIESFLKKVDKQYLDLQQKQSNEWLVRGLQKDYPINKYLYEFKWNDAKYPRSFPIPRVAETFEVKLADSQSDIRKKTNTYNETRVQLSQNTQKQGNYNVRDLTDLLVEPKITSQDFTYTKFLTTLIVIVPSSSIQEFLENYQFFTSYVVPKSAKKFQSIPQKDGLTIWKVNIFTVKIQQQQQLHHQDHHDQKLKKQHKRNLPPINQFIQKARQKMKLVVKEFKFQSGFADTRKKKKENLQTVLKLNAKNLSDACRNHFSEIYDLYIHAKFLRLIIETNMRFGSDPTVIYLIETVPGKQKNVLMILVQVFGDKQNEGLYGTKEEIDDGEDFFPFIYAPTIVL